MTFLITVAHEAEKVLDGATQLRLCPRLRQLAEYLSGRRLPALLSERAGIGKSRAG